MTDTPHLHLPLLSPAQAQKHVTVNEALSRLDGLVQLRLVSLDIATPPAVVTDGACYGVPAGAVNAWAGQDGMVAIGVNGGWDFVTPTKGFRAFVLDRGAEALHDGASWRIGAATLGPGGAGLNLHCDEIDLSLSAAATATAAGAIPARAIVFGVTGRVVAAIGGPSAWRIGVAGDDLRFGSGLGTALNSWVSGPVAPIVYWSATDLLVSAEGADFTGGALRLAVHYALLSVPDAV
ncbi:DUF2793 domain-containing protein [Rhodobacterales bacterium HKCCE2091]|nr:DUF2793 domain-containing protein [Rhodobacterales bacterium HKCCE2091]